MSRKIIVLSDGTGNGASVYTKTNVWRLYQAIDLHDPNQIAFYDDGVGSRQSTFDKVMGGAFGVGLRRNVLEMYEFLCRNYQPGDRIYLFGFSRGAFTIRLLAGFIRHAGLYTDYGDEATLHTIAIERFHMYKWDCCQGCRKGLLWRLWRSVFRITDETSREHEPVTQFDIEFIGAWDTVDAYVFPVDEMAQVWDQYIYPIVFTNHVLVDGVKRAYHALAADDERHTFHPVMWDESWFSYREHRLKPEITQVWFPGMHSDVGGGYARKSLSLVTLRWMMDHVDADTHGDDGIRFNSELRKQYLEQSDWNGPMHNSRSGLASYFRYRPRNIQKISMDTGKHIVPEVRVHRGLMERIASGSTPYAPTALPERYVIDSPPAGEESRVRLQEKDAGTRFKATSVARDIIVCRRGLYYLLLVTSITLLASRYFLDWSRDGVCDGFACFLDLPMRTLMYVLPDATHGWLYVLLQNKWWLLGFVVAFYVLFRARRWLRRSTQEVAADAWRELKCDTRDPGCDEQPRVRQFVCSGLARRLEKFFSAGFVRLCSTAFIVLVLCLLLALANGFVFHAWNILGGSISKNLALCRSGGDGVLVEPGEMVTRRFSADDACYDTGVQLEAGHRYRFTISSDQLCDKYYQATADGLMNKPVADRCTLAAGVYPHVVDEPPGAFMLLSTPLRRHVSQPWFRLHGRVGSQGNEVFVLGEGQYEYTSRSTGRLFLYLNDAVLGYIPSWDHFYISEAGKNTGTIKIRIEQKQKVTVTN